MAINCYKLGNLELKFKFGNLDIYWNKLILVVVRTSVSCAPGF